MITYSTVDSNEKASASIEAKVKELNMTEQKPYRELKWWERYLLHKWWCHDVCPLVPRFEYRKGDEFNSNKWYIHWLILKVWTLDHFAFKAEINIEPHSIFVGFIVPYLRILIGFHHIWHWNWLNKVVEKLRRKPAITRKVFDDF